MAEALNFLNPEMQASPRLQGYQTQSVHQIRARATHVDQQQSNEERKGLRRLNQILSQDQPLIDDVPRGFYLNIKV
jgi:hypothetical protein